MEASREDRQADRVVETSGSGARWATYAARVIRFESRSGHISRKICRFQSVIESDSLAVDRRDGRREVASIPHPARASRKGARSRIAKRHEGESGLNYGVEEDHTRVQHPLRRMRLADFYSRDGLPVIAAVELRRELQGMVL